MSTSAKNIRSTRGENCDRVTVTVPIAASIPMTTYHPMITASAMALSSKDAVVGQRPRHGSTKPTASSRWIIRNTLRPATTSRCPAQLRQRRPHRIHSRPKSRLRIGPDHEVVPPGPDGAGGVAGEHGQPALLAEVGRQVV